MQTKTSGKISPLLSRKSSKVTRRLSAEVLALSVQRLGGGRSKTACLTAHRYTWQSQGSVTSSLGFLLFFYTEAATVGDHLGRAGIEVGSELSLKHLVLSAGSYRKIGIKCIESHPASV